MRYFRIHDDDDDDFKNFLAQLSGKDKQFKDQVSHLQQSHQKEVRGSNIGAISLPRTQSLGTHHLLTHFVIVC